MMQQDFRSPHKVLLSLEMFGSVAAEIDIFNAKLSAEALGYSQELLIHQKSSSLCLRRIYQLGIYLLIFN
jgi:hypothetical protein